MVWQQNVDLLELNLDHGEWDVLDTMLHRGELRHVRQLLLYVNIEDTQHSSAYIDQLRRGADVLRRLEESGYHKWRSYAYRDTVLMSPLTGTRRPHKYMLNYINTRLSAR